MDEFLSKLANQAAVIRAAPYPFMLAVVIAAGAIWFVLNWAYSSVLSSKNAQLELADRQLADYRQKLSGATPEEARQRIDSLESKVSQLEGISAPRTLSPVQRATLLDKAQLPSGVTAKIGIFGDATSCIDCNAYATELAAVFKRIPGWTVSEGTVMFPARKSASGTLVQINNPNQLDEKGAVLLRALQAADLKFEIGDQSGMPGVAPGQVPPDAGIMITARLH